ncbi:uncharacterized protein PGTG_04955 [Puccinia graminis f. sp. tritici CRL 75-36-700-3]|uniref:Uncharacterized protein n=1 Tax=Puccinia graminis f. sp. tritici (strain CRL 75-36-700-3 / race SCCL) TaxID=418459 RepID=E3K3E2_PUCGT|nr:uncharacterized protein PGTG_04955 [Puccinia graminis f. sp. tritici CRL 75-36-700-3]EFP78999.1 hypothetical protein PGTG_04955 [Puccinia graminis f. sp. tritici CRL 75-36-700-3]
MHLLLAMLCLSAYVALFSMHTTSKPSMRSAERKSGISLSFDSVDTIKGESINSRDYGFEPQSPSNGYANSRAMKKAESFRTRPAALESTAPREIGFAPQSPHDYAQSRQFQRGSSTRGAQQDGSRAGGLSYLLRNEVQASGPSLTRKEGKKSSRERVYLPLDCNHATRHDNQDEEYTETQIYEGW